MNVPAYSSRYQRNRPAGPAWYLLLALVVCSMACPSAAAPAQKPRPRQLALDSVNGTLPPRLINRSVHYFLDLSFDAAPRHFWTYYRNEDSTLVVDFYGAVIQGPKKKVLSPRTSPFKQLRVKNEQSTLSLSEHRSRLLINADNGWGYQAETRDSTVVRVTAIQQKPQKNSTTYRRWIPLIAIISCLAVAGAAGYVAFSNF